MASFEKYFRILYELYISNISKKKKCDMLGNQADKRKRDISFQ